MAHLNSCKCWSLNLIWPELIVDAKRSESYKNSFKFESLYKIRSGPIILKINTIRKTESKRPGMYEEHVY